MFNPYNNPYNQFGSAQFQNTDFDPYTTDNFAQNDRQPYIEGVNQGQTGNPMLGQVSEGSLYPIASSTDTPYLNNNMYSTYAKGGHVNSLHRRNPEFEEDEAFEEMPIFDADFDTDIDELEQYKPYHSLAEIIRRQGEGEDTILAHINPVEAAILKSMGGGGTINPKTGLPQFGLFSNPKKWFKSVAGPAAGVVLGNMILPGLGGIIGGALGGAAGSSARGRKDHLQSALRGASMGAMAPTAAGLLGSGARSIGSIGVGDYLTNYGTKNAILPSIGMGNSGSVGQGSIGGASMGGDAIVETGKGASKRAAEEAASRGFIDSLVDNSKDFFTQPSNIMSTAVLANQLIPKGEKKVKEKTPEEIAANEKRYRNAIRLSKAELEAEAAYTLAQREAKRRAKNNLYGLEDASIPPLYRKVSSPAEYENTRRWLEYYDNPGFTGNQVRMKDGGTFIEEIEYPMGIVGYLQGYSGGQDDDINARLSDGEYVIDASTVSDIGDGNNANGAKKLDQMRRNIRAHKRGGNLKMPPKAKSLLSYMRD